MKKRILATVLSIILSTSLFLTDAAPALAQGLAGFSGEEADNMMEEFTAGVERNEETDSSWEGSSEENSEEDSKETAENQTEEENSENSEGEDENSESLTEENSENQGEEENSENTEETSENLADEEDSENADEEIGDTEEPADSEDEEELPEDEILFPEEGFTEGQLEKQEEAREKLQVILDENLVLALIYLTEEYDMQDKPGKEGRTLASLPSGTTVVIKDIALDSDNRIWYQVDYYTEESCMTGYVLRDYLITACYAFLEWEEEYISAFQIDMPRTFAATVTDDPEINAFPYGFRSTLVSLKKKHPNWHFVPYKTGVTIDTAVEEEYKNNRCLVPYNSALRDNDTQIEPGWCQASRDAIRYYLNPQNFLTDEKIFQFESLTYNANNAKLNVIEEIVKGTFMDNQVPDGTSFRYSSYILQGGIESKVNPYHLAARLKQEQGSAGTSPLISGTYPGYEGYYNYFNIGASGSTKALIYQNGLEYAKKQGWNSRFASIVGGSKILGNRYVLIGQDTLYLQKFDFVDTYYTHQYMQNLLAPYNEAASMRKAYVSSDSINNAFVFKIPVFLEPLKMSVEKAEMDYNSDNKITMKIGSDTLPARAFQYASSDESVLTIDEEGKIKSYEKSGIVTVKATCDFDAGMKKLEANKSELEKELEALTGEETESGDAGESGNGENGGSEKEKENEAKVAELKEKIAKISDQIEELKVLKKAYKEYNKKSLSATVKVCGIEIINETDVIRKGTFRQLNLNYVLPKNLSAGKMKYETSDPDVISIDTKGKMTALKVGKAQITVSCGEKYSDFRVFYVCPDGFIWAETPIALKPGETESISLQWNKEDIAGQSDWPEQIKKASEVKYSSSDETVVKVSENGIITAVSCGKAKITASMECGFVKDREVNVAAAITFVNEKASAEDQVIYTEYQTSLDSIPEGTDVEGWHFAGWYTEKEGKGNRLESNTLFLKDQTFYGFYLEAKEDFLVLPIGEQIYTGKALKPEVKVYDGNTPLQLGKDYTLQYSKNTNVGTASVKVVGKGNYTGWQVTNFEIKAKDISDSDVTAVADDTRCNKKKITTKPVLTYNGKKLAVKKDFTFEYDTKDGIIIEAGSYMIKVQGQGNYTGTRMVPINVTENLPVSKFSLSAVPNQPYNEGNEIRPPMVIKDGSKVLEEGVDYSLQYKNNREIGTASIIIKGEGKYYGERTKTFKITGTKISSAKITGWTSTFEYDGNEHRQDPKVLTLNYKNNPLVYEKDYKIDYLTDVTNAGKVTVMITGINGYYGTVKKTYTISAYDLKKDDLLEEGSQNIKVNPVKDTPYRKGGSKPSGEAVAVFYKGKSLEEGKDYTLSYGNNNAVTTELTSEKKLPSITIKGKGNFKGTKKVTFKITPGNIAECENYSLASDVVYKNKKNAFKPTLSIVAPNGKKLSAGTDFEKVVACQPLEQIKCEDGTVLEPGKDIEPDCILPAGSRLKVIVTGKNNYAGSTVELEYRIVRKNISGAKVKIKKQFYTGGPIFPQKADVDVRFSATEILEFGEDYEFVPGSEMKNVNKGTATVTIRGKGNYGGTKKVTFAIGNKAILPFRILK